MPLRSSASRSARDEAPAFEAGEFVEVLSEAEILRTLDSRGTLDSLPFMPEMLEFCGKRLRVGARAHKTCDTIDWGTMRRMENAVHLVGVRCDGSAHGGCQAGCLIFWKDTWLRRVDGAGDGPAADSTPDPEDGLNSLRTGCSRDALIAAAQSSTPDGDVFSCQATELIRATTSELPWWDVQQYVDDIRSRNASTIDVLQGLFVGFLNKLQKASTRVLPNGLRVRGGRTYPFLLGKRVGGTPSDVLHLQPGELVEVKSREEIFATLNEKNSTRGLRFDGEMLRYCGRRGRVLRRVDRIIDEKSGKMLPINSDCIIIDEFVCRGDYHRSCPRRVYTWWREAWLRRVE